MKRFIIVILIVIGFSIVIFNFLLDTNITEWNIEVLDLSNIVENNPLTVQEELKAPQILQEDEIRIAAFRIRDQKGNLIQDHVAQLWQKKGILRGFSIGLEGRSLWFRFCKERIEIWTSADKFFTAQGQVILSLFDNDQVIASATADVSVSNLPVQVEDINK